MVAKVNGTIESVDGDSLIIRIERTPGFAEGDRVTVQIEKVDDDWPRRRDSILELCGVWKDDEDIGRIFDEIRAEKCAAAGCSGC